MVTAGTSVLVHNCGIGFTYDTVDSAFTNMRGGGGHAMNHVITDGVIPNKGSLASKVEVLKKKVSPVLTNPRKTFDWRLGDTQTRAFVGEVDGRMVVVFVAKDAPYKGNVISGWVVTPKNKVQWGL